MKQVCHRLHKVWWILESVRCNRVWVSQTYHI